MFVYFVFVHDVYVCVCAHEHTHVLVPCGDQRPTPSIGLQFVWNTVSLIVLYSACQVS